MACFPEQGYEERGQPSRWFARDMGRILRLPSIGQYVRSSRALRCDAKVHFIDKMRYQLFHRIGDKTVAREYPKLEGYGDASLSLIQTLAAL